MSDNIPRPLDTPSEQPAQKAEVKPSYQDLEAALHKANLRLIICQEKINDLVGENINLEADVRELKDERAGLYKRINDSEKRALEAQMKLTKVEKEKGPKEDESDA